MAGVISRIVGAIDVSISQTRLVCGLAIILAFANLLNFVSDSFSGLEAVRVRNASLVAGSQVNLKLKGEIVDGRVHFVVY